jgi:hypothetical protein
MASPPPPTEPRPPEPRDHARLVGVKLGNYRLERIIGRGRMGVVYLAKDEALLRPTAIKVLAWSADEARGQDPVQWFLSEARLVARINDQRVVQIYGAARQGDWCYIAMEYVAGQSAEALLTLGGRLDARAATDVLLQAAAALSAAHRSGVIHRDVKPGNLLMGPEGITKLSDFGMAHGGPGERGGNVHVRAGTPFYTAPEVWRGGGASAASDIYSLGATYFHLLTGRPPFPAQELPAVEQAHLTAPPPDARSLVPGLPASCAALLARALAKSPADRHASAQELMWDARRVLQDLSGPASATAAAARPAGAPGQAAVPTPPELPAVPQPLPPAPAILAGALAFTHRPFGAVDPAGPPFQAEPLTSARRRLEAALADPAAPVVILTAPRGGGATTLLRRTAAEARRGRLVLALDVRAGQDGRTLLQRLASLAGLPDGDPAGAEGLLVWLADERRQRRAPPLVVLDGVQLPHPSATGLAALVGGALAARAASLLLAGPPGLPAALARAVDLRDRPPVEVALPPLDADQVAHYVRAWLAATRPAGAPPIVFSPDALLLLARRSEGVLERIGRLAENMLVLAAAGRQRTITSWHAWAASERDRWADAGPAPALPPRPGGWPPPEVVGVIDECRRSAGLSPWPRPARGTP